LIAVALYIGKETIMFNAGDFGRHVRELRKRAGMTLEMMARAIRSHKGYVSGIENNKVNPPSVKILKLYARAFRLDEEKTQELILMACVEKIPHEVRAFVALAVHNEIVYRAGAASASVGAAVAQQPAPVPQASAV
jgi:transcriptional regulator with XRE-family HTH domain